jgi:hypothetical protein
VNKPHIPRADDPHRAHPVKHTAAVEREVMRKLASQSREIGHGFPYNEPNVGPENRSGASGVSLQAWYRAVDQTSTLAMECA